MALLSGGRETLKFNVALSLAPEPADPSMHDDTRRRLQLESCAAAAAELARDGAQKCGASEDEFLTSALESLVMAADDFIVRREVEGRQLLSVIAGAKMKPEPYRSTMQIPESRVDKDGWFTVCCLKGACFLVLVSWFTCLLRNQVRACARVYLTSKFCFNSAVWL